MSVPRKHHYVPRVHISRFKTENGYNLYLKKNGSFTPRNPQHEEKIFFEKDLNSTINWDNGEIDHKSIEDELGKKWDDKFNKHFKIIIEWIIEFLANDQLGPLPEQETMKFFFEYGLVAYFRKAKTTKEFNNGVFDMINDVEGISNDIIEEVRQQYLKIEDNLPKPDDLMNVFRLVTEESKKLKFPMRTPIGLPFLVPEKCSMDLVIAQEGSFILTDYTSMNFKSSKKTYVYSVEYNMIESVSFPLTPYIMLNIKNNDLLPNSNSGIYGWKKEKVIEYNKASFNIAENQIITIDRDMVELLVKQ